MTAAIIGIPLAFFTSNRRFKGRKFILSLNAIPLCMPSLIVALAYISFFGANGTAGLFLHKITGGSRTFTFLYTTPGIIIAQGFYNFPYITGIVSKAWNNLPQEQENSARLLGASETRILFSITLKRLSGAIAAACIPVFLFCFFSFMIVLLFSPMGRSTVEVRLYQSLHATLNLKEGAWLCILETITALLFVYSYSRLSKKSQSAQNDQYFAKQSPCRLCKSKWQTKGQRLIEGTAFTVLIILILLFFICPAFGIIKNGLTVRKNNRLLFSLNNFKELFGSKKYISSIVTSVIISSLTGFFCCLCGFIYSSLLVLRKKGSNQFLQLLPMIPMAISPIVISWCAVLIFKRTSPALLIVLEVIIYSPIAYRQLQNGLNAIPKDTVNAAKLLSKNNFDAVIRLLTGYSKKYLLTSFIMCFSMSMGDASLPLVLSIRDFSTLALYTYRLSGKYRFNQACASSIILAFLCCTGFILIEKLTEKKADVS